MQSQAKLSKRPYLLSDIRVVQFRRGSRNMHVKQYHTDSEFAEFDFLMKNHKPSVDYHTPLRTQDRGIPAAKKSDIIAKLLPLIPSNRHNFWQNIATSENVADLIDANDE